MAGSKLGGLKASLKNKKLYGKDFYQRIGAMGGKKGTGGGFAAMPKWKVSEAGRKGGSKSRRSK